MKRGFLAMLLVSLALIAAVVACSGGRARGGSCCSACNLGCVACTTCTAIGCAASCLDDGM